VVAIPFARRFWNEHPRRAKVIVAVAAAVTGIAVLSGAAAVLLDRVLTSASVVTRLAMWGPLVEAWVSKPLTGFGPGSFPWILQQTPYFETNSLAPRHPDNAIVQLLGEGGVVGLAAMGIVIGVGVVAVVRTRSIAARFPLICFGVACVNANPSDFMFLVAVAIGWAAYALPRAAATEPAPRASRLLKAATVACAAVIGVAWTSTAVADVSYASARSAVESGNFSSAAEQLALAESLDPGMALYRRQHGAALLQLGDVDGAIEDLEAAVRINPSDDLAWRVLALARDAQDDPASARSAIDQALAAQRSDPANLLVSATLAAERGDDGEVNRTLEEVVQAWPEIVTAPGWDGLLSPGISSQVVLGAAFGRWLDGIVGPEPSALQPMTLAVMTGQPELAAAEADAVLGPSLGPAYLQVLGCDPAGDATLAAAPNSDRRDAVYWLLVARQARAEGQPDAQAERLFWLMTHAPFFEAEPVPPLNPLNDVRGGYSSDQAGYRRLGLFWPDFHLLPSPAAGQTQWFGYPHDAVEAVGLESLIQACR
jgi:tetratricopeptide (TPR) repeat protein